MANLALGIAALLERQASRRQFILGPAIGTFEDHHSYYAPTVDDVEGPTFDGNPAIELMLLIRYLELTIAVRASRFRSTVFV